MYGCNCGREFKIKQHYDMHKLYCKGPRYCQNEECNNLLIKASQKKFCSASCSGKVTTKGRNHTEETRIKISKSLGGTGEIKVRKRNMHLSREEKNRRISEGIIKYYSKICKNIPYENLSYKRRKEILWEEQNKCCNKCGFNLYNEKDGPYQIHHVDGNNLNRLRENEELLCLNCHYITDSYGFKNKSHTKQTKLKLQKASRIQHSKRKVPTIQDKISV